MNTIKNMFYNFWKKILNVLGFTKTKVIKSDEVEIYDLYDSEKNNSACSDSNCQCENCCEENCSCQNREIKESKEDVTSIVENNISEKFSGRDTVIVYYTDETITRDVLIAELRKNGVKGISRLKRAELLAKFHEMNLEFPEVV